MMTSILTSWNHSFAASGGQSGSQLLILPNAMIDKAGFARLTSLRDDEEVLLFE